MARAVPEWPGELWRCGRDVLNPTKCGSSSRKPDCRSNPTPASELFAFGSGADPADTFFTFLDSSLAAFGRLHDLKALLDVREGSADALETNQTFRSYEAELEGRRLSGESSLGKLLRMWLRRGCPEERKTPLT